MLEQIVTQSSLVLVALVCFPLILLTACHAYLPGCVPKGGTNGTARATVNLEPDWNPFNRGKFVPPSVTVRAGSLVTWTYKETTTAHSITADDGRFDSCEMVAGRGARTEFTVAFTRPGTVKYHCRVHSGMRGTIKVT
jgi:plastocyanin